MPFTLGAFAEDIDAAGATVNITALQDDTLFTQGDDLRVPQLNQIIGVGGGLGSGGDGLMRLESPSLRQINRLQINPLNGLGDADVEPSDPPAWVDMSLSPRRLDIDEILQCVIDSDTSAAAFQWCLILFGDGKPTPTSGEIITVHADGATTVTARAWSTVTITFVDTLPVGNYQVVGLRPFGATMIAARFIFKPGTWRPGAMGLDSQTSMNPDIFRYGRLGIWGEFASVTPPDLEVLCGSADSAQDFEIDLIKVS